VRIAILGGTSLRLCEGRGELQIPTAPKISVPLFVSRVFAPAPGSESLVTAYTVDRPARFLKYGLNNEEKSL
jgi:hypothetical protein